MKNLYTIILSVILLVMMVFTQSIVRVDFVFIGLIASSLLAYYLNKKTNSIIPEIIFKSILIVLLYLSLFTPVVKNIYQFYIN
jgi:hypothetical protein